MNIFNNLEPAVFIIALCIGLGMTYIFTPAPRIIYKYPTPFNSGEITYKNSADTCYKYDARVITCPNDKKLIKPHVIE